MRDSDESRTRTDSNSSSDDEEYKEVKTEVNQTYECLVKNIRTIPSYFERTIKMVAN